MEKRISIQGDTVYCTMEGSIDMNKTKDAILSYVKNWNIDDDKNAVSNYIYGHYNIYVYNEADYSTYDIDIFNTKLEIGAVCEEEHDPYTFTESTIDSICKLVVSR